MRKMNYPNETTKLKYTKVNILMQSRPEPNPHNFPTKLQTLIRRTTPASVFPTSGPSRERPEGSGAEK